MNTDRQKNIESLIKTNAKYANRNRTDEFIIDGLFLTEEDVIRICGLFEEECDFKTIEVHYWERNVESCLWNDKYRRDENSEITIRNAILEKPNMEILGKSFSGKSILFVEHMVIRKSGFKMFADKHGIFLSENNTKMRSNSWCLGGFYRNCWGDEGSISAEPTPASFEEFDSLLESICPNITFLQYKNIYNACVSTDTCYESDYYGGQSTSAYFECDIRILYEKLLEYGFIEEEFE